MSIHDALARKEWDLEEIRLILERDSSSINEVDKLGRHLTPLLRVLMDGRCSVALIKLLLYYGADPNYVPFWYIDYYCTPLYLAVSENGSTETEQVEIVRALVEGGAKAVRSDDHYDTLYSAIDRNAGLEIIRLLLSAGADLFRAGNTEKSYECPLFYAIRTPAYCSNVTAFRSLLDLQDVDINIVRDRDNGSLLQCALNTLCTAEFAKFLIDRGIDVNDADDDGWTPLHIAVGLGYQLDMVDVLLKRGALVSAKNKYGETSLDIAITYSCHLDVVHLLLKYFLLENPNLDTEDWVQHEARRSKILDYANDCKCELQRMKSENVGNGRTLFEFLKMYSVMSRDGEYGFNIDCLLQIISKKQYPLYSNVMSSKFGHSLLTDKLEECNIRTVVENRPDVRCETTEISLNFDCACALANHLEGTDLLSVIMAFCN